MKKILSTWFDTYRHMPQSMASDSSAADTYTYQQERVQWLRVTPFVLMHIACLAVLFVGFSYVALAFAVGFYLLRMFAITGFYHRYFSHKTFKTSRAVQALFAIIGASSTQKGALWWAAHHRHHHRHADTELDVHSPKKGFFWSHMGWFLSDKHFATQHHLIRDFVKYPELVWIDRFALVIPLIFAAGIYGLGEWLFVVRPDWGTNGLQLLVWGFFISTVCLTHATLLINSLAHKWGSRRYPTQDDSRNNFFLALITLGEGWHNNHHFCPGTVRQGFRWWQVDVTYYVLKMMSWFGLVWDLKPIPAKAFEQQNYLSKDTGETS